MRYARLKKHNEFQRLFKKGKKVYSRYLTIVYQPHRQNTVMGIALSKKHGKAVKRNRIKRLIRAAFSNNMDKLAGNFSIIILPKVCEEYSYAEIERSILACFGRMT